MENTYYLIVEQQADGRRLRTIDEYASADCLVADAADYEAGEFPGRWVGALTLSFDSSGRLIATLPLTDVAADVHAELASRSEWLQRQATLDHWPARQSTMGARS